VVIAVKVKKGDIFNGKTLTKIRNMTSDVELWDEVYRVLTVSMASNSTKVVNLKGRRDHHRSPHVPGCAEDAEGHGASEKKRLLQPCLQWQPRLQGRNGLPPCHEFKENISYSRIFKLLRALEKKYSDENTTIHVVGFPC